MIVLSVLVAAAAAGVWAAFWDQGFVQAAGFVLLGVAALWGVTSASDATRVGVMDIRAFTGHGPEAAPPDGTGVMTGLAVMLFVSLPLAALGFFLLANS